MNKWTPKKDVTRDDLHYISKQHNAFVEKVRDDIRMLIVWCFALSVACGFLLWRASL